MYRFTTYETNGCIALPKIVKQCLIEFFESFGSNLSVPESVYGIQVLYEGNRIVFLLA